MTRQTADRDLTRKRLRSFGFTVGVAACILAALLFWRAKAAWPIAAGFGGVLLLLGALAPGLLRPIEWAWMKVALALGWFMTRVILGIVFFLVFTPAGLILRLLRKDPLGLRLHSAAESYWNPREGSDRSPERMERMF